MIIDNYSKPAKCEITLHYKCNANCIHCYQDSNVCASEKECKGVEKKILKAYKNGARILSLIGGEPTLDPRITRFAKLAKKVGYKHILLTTNSLKLSDPEYVDVLVKSGIDSFKLDFHSINPEIHNTYLQRIDAYDNLMKSIENIKKYKNVCMAFATVVTSLNYKDIPNIADFVTSKLNIANFHFIACHNEGKVKEENKFLLVPYSKQKPYLMEIIRIVKSKKLKPGAHMFSNYPPCLLSGYEHLIADWSVKRTYMDEVFLPDSDEPKKIIELLKMGKTKLEICSKCIYKDECIGVEKGYLDIENDFSVFRPIIKTREYAPKIWGTT